MRPPPAKENSEQPADRALAELAALGRETAAFLREQISRAPEPAVLTRYLLSYAERNGLPHDRQELQGLAILAGQSPFLGSLLLQNPAYLPWTLDKSSRGADGPTPEDLRQDLARFRFTLSTLSDAAILRRFKHREFLRIALRDYWGRADLADTTRDLSILADTLLGEAHRLALQDLVNRFGPPQYLDDQGRIAEATFAVLSLGKLGGEELNYSSDIDVIYLFSREGHTAGMQGDPDSVITNREFFTRLAEELTQQIGGISTEGQVFRVDLGLRPGGKDGELVHSFRAALAYYRTWAKTWERQALIKARHSAGDPELGRAFLEAVQETIYANEAAPFQALEIKEMKDRIDAELSRSGASEAHVKLGRGGLRELEFAVQALQLTRGGGDPWLREGNTLRALHRLADRGLVSFGEHASLSRAYLFLRTVEHRLQLERNRQVNAIPPSPESLLALARRMGYLEAPSETVAFMRDLEVHREAVRAFYDAVLGRAAQRSLVETAKDPFLDAIPAAELRALLREAGVDRAEETLRCLHRIRKLLSMERIRPNERRGMRRVSAAILREAAGGAEPERGFANLERFLQALLLDPGSSAFFFQRPEWIPPLMRLFGKSQYLSQILARRPEVLMEMGMVSEYLRGPDPARMASHLAPLLLEAGEIREAAGVLRRFHQVQILLIGIRDVHRQDSLDRVLETLSGLAEASLAASESAASRLTKEDESHKFRFCVLGLGRLGYHEMDYNSDLDLVFVADSEESPQGVMDSARRRAESLIHLLTAATREGSLYSVDLRLRPGGREGDLVQSRRRLLSYFRESAQTWEKMAFLKARPVAGDLSLGWEVVHAIEEEIFDAAAAETLASEAREMKERLESTVVQGGADELNLKLAPGGILDIHFLIEYLQIRHRLRGPSDRTTLRMLATLRSHGLIPDEDYPNLYSGYLFLRNLDHLARLLQDRTGDSLPSTPAGLGRLAREIGPPFSQAEEGSGDRLLERLREVRARVRESFLRLVR